MDSELLNRYTADQRRVIEEYWSVIRSTRRSGKVADSVFSKELAYWSRFPQDVVDQALKIHIRKHPKKKEAYTRGIMRELAREKTTVGGGPGKSGSMRGNYGKGKYGGHYLDGSDENGVPF